MIRSLQLPTGCWIESPQSCRKAGAGHPSRLVDEVEDLVTDCAAGHARFRRVANGEPLHYESPSGCC